MKRRTALIVAALCWVVFALVVAMVHAHVTDGLDRAGLLMWRRSGDLALPRGPAWLLEAVRDLTALGGPLLRNLFAVGALAGLMAIGATARAARLFIAVCGGWLVDVVLKLLVGRARPTVVPHLMAVTGGSFPSGHSFNAAVVYVSIALAFAPVAERRAARTALVATAAVLSLLVSLSRVWLGVHYPTDVVAGWLGGTGWALLLVGFPRGNFRLGSPAQAAKPIPRNEG